MIRSTLRRLAVGAIAVTALLSAELARAQGVGGIAGWAIVGRSTVAAMPAAASVTRGLWIVTDAATSSTCATGGGSNVVVCVDQGSAWAALTGGGGVPATHASTHQDGGSDEISVAGLAGLLATAQTPAAHTQDASTISDSTAAGRSLLTAADAAAQRGALGLGTAATKDVPASGDAAAGEVVKGNDSRLADARTPTAHASTHASAGSDSLSGTLAVDVTGNATTATTASNLTCTDCIGSAEISTLAPADVGLGNVTNDAQTKASVVPNTAPAAGQVLVGNAGGTAYVPRAISGDATLDSAGALTIGADKVMAGMVAFSYATSSSEGGDAIGLTCSTCVDATDLASDAVTEPKLDAMDAPGDEEVLTWEATGSRFEWQAASGGASPAGSGSELQYRVDGSTFGAVTSSSVSGANITLGGSLSGVTQLNVDNLRLDGNTLSSTDTNGNITLAPNGTGLVAIGTNNATALSDDATFLGGAHALLVSTAGTIATSKGVVARSLALTTGSNHATLSVPSGSAVAIGDYLGTTKGDLWLRDSYHYNSASSRLIAVSAAVGVIAQASGGKYCHSSSATEAYPSLDTCTTRVGASILGLRDGGSGGAALSLVEQTAPAAPATNGGYFFLQDSGSGKTQACVRFATGASQCFATEP